MRPGRAGQGRAGQGKAGEIRPENPGSQVLDARGTGTLCSLLHTRDLHSVDHPDAVTLFVTSVPGKPPEGVVT